MAQGESEGKGEAEADHVGRVELRSNNVEELNCALIHHTAAHCSSECHYNNKADVR